MKEGVPSTIEDKLYLNKASIAHAGFTEEEIRNNVSGFIQKPSKVLKDWLIEDLYLYFDKSPKSIDVKVGSGIYIPFELNKYGFNLDEINFEPTYVNEIPLNDSSKTQYMNLVNSRNESMPNILETIGSAVNNSIEYDFDRIKKLERQDGLFKSDLSQARKTYNPTGKEITKGICRDAGKSIRKILGALGLPENYKVIHSASEKNGLLHDNTIVFDKLSGNWGVINSKSPVKNFNYATKEQLVLLGKPYINN